MTLNCWYEIKEAVIESDKSVQLRFTRENGLFDTLTSYLISLARYPADYLEWPKGTLAERTSLPRPTVGEKCLSIYYIDIIEDFLELRNEVADTMLYVQSVIGSRFLAVSATLLGNFLNNATESLKYANTPPLDCLSGIEACIFSVRAVAEGTRSIYGRVG